MPVVAKSRVRIRWNDPAGWFAGTVTSSRLIDNRWNSRVLYDNCQGWRGHSNWHYLHRSDPQCEDWELIVDSSDEEPAEHAADA